MPDTRWILSHLEWLKGRGIPFEDVEWIGVTLNPNEIVLIKFIGLDRIRNGLIRPRVQDTKQVQSV